MNIKISRLFSLFFLLYTLSAVAQKEQYSLLVEDNNVSDIPLVKERKEKIQKTLAMPIPILILDEPNMTPQQRLAQIIATSSPQFINETKAEGQAMPYLNEIFGINPARPSDYSAQSSPECADGTCYRVEMYNYALNQTTIGLVHLGSKKITRMGKFAHTQPDIPQHLKKLALEIAIASNAVEKALGFKPTIESALMADTKTALNRSRCERSKHLCVAPTFVKNEKALWAVVDLTEMNLVGIRWTNVGQQQVAPTERKLQNDYLTECFCKKVNSTEQHGWKLNYLLTSSDGLRISEVDYKGKRVINSAKLVDWHVNYSNTDGFGYSDAVGCPFFSAAAVVAINPPKIMDMVEEGKVIGFTIEQDFFSEGWPTACNYNYKQRFEFYDDGRFRAAVASLGRGCGNNGTYRPVTRIAFAGKNKFSQWKGDTWQQWKKEQWYLQEPTTSLTKENYQYKIQSSDQTQGFYMMSNIGQFNDGGRGDNAYVYVTKNKHDADEGESDLVTIGPCCNTDYHQGPEKFIEPTPDSIEDDELIVWYVPQIRNDDTKGREYCWAESFLENGIFQTKVYPCFSGAMWVPIE